MACVWLQLHLLVALLISATVLPRLVVSSRSGLYYPGLVTEFPGYEPSKHPYAPSLKDTTYSDFIDIGGGKKFHFVFTKKLTPPTASQNVESSNEKLALWLTGGPGSSSMMAFYTEKGPLSLNDDSLTNGNINGTIRPKFNNYTWNYLANIIYLESPVGVGFSRCEEQYCDDPDDYSVANDNYLFLQTWLEQFPKYKDMDFYLLGESYSGVYIPTLVSHIPSCRHNIFLVTFFRRQTGFLMATNATRASK